MCSCVVVFSCLLVVMMMNDELDSLFVIWLPHRQWVMWQVKVGGHTYEIALVVSGISLE